MAQTPSLSSRSVIHAVAKMYPVKRDAKSGILLDIQPLCTSMFFLLLSVIFILLRLYKLQVTAVRRVQPTIYTITHM
jgi:hypothetical protein